MFRDVLKSQAMVLHNCYFRKSLNNPEVDKWRDVVIGIFKTKLSTKKKDVLDATKAALGEEIPAAVYQKVMKELAYSKGTTWIFKSGNGGGK